MAPGTQEWSRTSLRLRLEHVRLRPSQSAESEDLVEDHHIIRSVCMWGRAQLGSLVNLLFVVWFLLLQYKHCFISWCWFIGFLCPHPRPHMCTGHLLVEQLCLGSSSCRWLDLISRLRWVQGTGCLVINRWQIHWTELELNMQWSIPNGQQHQHQHRQGAPQLVCSSLYSLCSAPVLSADHNGLNLIHYRSLCNCAGKRAANRKKPSANSLSLSLSCGPLCCILI